MSEATQTLPDFLKTKVAARFRDMVAKAEQRLVQAQRDVDDLRAASGTISWEVGNPQPTRWFVNVADGEMAVSEQAASAPFMTVALSAADWARFVSGGAPGGLFADDDRPLGKARMERVRALKGAMRFVLTGFPGGDDFTATLYFGNERPAEPQATIQMSTDTAVKIQKGTLNPQAAFMQGLMQLVGDMGFAMQLGMALFL